MSGDMGASQANGLGSAEAPEPHSGLGPSDAIPSAAVPSFGFDQHDTVTNYDHHSCSRCDWYAPDRTARRGTAAVHGEWFPSVDAFLHYARTGVRAWIGGSKCDRA